MENKKYFVTSDIHSFYTIFKNALEKSGFDINNQNHILIMCGDLLDRGDETLEVINFIKSIPKERRILIRGNHEYLLRNLIKKDYPESYDFSNGTVKSLFALAGYKNSQYNAYTKIFSYFGGWDEDDVVDLFDKASRNKKVKEYLKWVFESDEWVDFYEWNNYIFVHAFIPLINNSSMRIYSVNPKYLSYNPNWRSESTKLEIEDSTWGCPWELFNSGLFNEEIANNKILVCGHWHTEDFHRVYEDVFENYEIYFGNNLIALDACTAYSKTCNIMIIDNENNCYDSNNNKLKVISKIETKLNT